MLFEILVILVMSLFNVETDKNLSLFHRFLISFHIESTRYLLF